MRFRVLGSGSSGNATLVEADGTRILIDAGLAAAELAERVQDCGVDPASLAGVFLSHEHNDHARGAASFSRRWGVRIFGSRGTYAAAGLGAAEIAGYDALEPRVPRAVGSLTVIGIPVPHDAAGPFAFVVSNGGRRLGHATDFGHLQVSLVEAFKVCDAVLIESNYDTAMLEEGPYPWSVKARILGPWGHIGNEDIARYLSKGLGASCGTVVLAHLSRTNNHPDVARQAAEAALQRGGRGGVKLETTGPEGTGWFDVALGSAAPKGPVQLRLF